MHAHVLQMSMLCMPIRVCASVYVDVCMRKLAIPVVCRRHSLVSFGTCTAVGSLGCLLASSIVADSSFLEVVAAREASIPLAKRGC